MNRIHTYKFFVNEEKRKVIAISTYAGKTVRGVATCSEADEFDLEKGKQLAAARCNAKIAKKRQDRARQKSMMMEEKLREIKKECLRMKQYHQDASEALWKATLDLDNLLWELKK